MNELEDFCKKCNNFLLDKKLSYPINYLYRKRQFNDETLKEHMIGFCEWEAELPPAVRHFGENLDDKDKRDWTYSLWGRITVPIYDEFGNVVSIATKKPAKGKNPWWNMPFVKSNSLFLLNKARREMFIKNKVYIVEGYADALTLYQNGVKNVVAVMGTAFTLRKISLIARYCNQICFCFDVDENMSGQKASDKAIELLNQYSFVENVSVIDTIPLGEDPDSFVKSNGIKSYLSHERLLTKADILEACKRVHERKNNK